MISVIIPLYNNASTVSRAIQSVLNQTLSCSELIVVDDGSTDGSREVVEQVTDDRISLLTQANSGVAAARNRGIEMARGEWIAFLDADDEWKPGFLATCQNLIEQYPQCDVAATAYERLTPSGSTQQIILNNINIANGFILDNYFDVAATSDPPFCSISVMIRRDALRAMGGFPKGVHQGEDLITWARLASKYKIAYSCEPQAIFHTTEAQSQGRPRRIPSYDDTVGKELEMLYSSHPDIKGLPNYIAHWHKMRASMFLRLPNHNSECRKEIRLSRKWNKRNKKLHLYSLLLLLPYPVRMQLLKLSQ